MSRGQDHPPIPDILNGTECGRITPSSTLVGRRIVHDEHFGTICYVGPLPNSSCVWIGVDWDNSDRGRHDGSYKGKRYFQTRTATSGSFVRPNKISLGTSLEEALVFRYVLCPECQLSSQSVGSRSIQSDGNSMFFQPTDTPGHLQAFVDSSAYEKNLEFRGPNDDSDAEPFQIEIFTRPGQTPSGSDVQQNRHSACGPQGAASALKKLRSATFTLIPIYRALHGEPINETAYLWPSTGGTLGQLLPNLIDLDLGGCLLSRWVDVAQICAQLPGLKSLNVSNNRLRLPPEQDVDCSNQENGLLYDLDQDVSDPDALFSQAFPSIEKLVLIRCSLLNWTGLERIISWMPSLRSLALAYNELGNLPSDLTESAKDRLRQLVELDLTGTSVSDLSSLFQVLGPSTQLDTLLLNQNPISSLPTLPVQDGTEADAFSPSSWFTALTTLGLRQTSIADWKPLTVLLHFKKLEHLIFWDCPLTDGLTPETARQELIARLPSLPTLNRMPINSVERRGAELDYLKRYGDAWRAMGGTGCKLHTNQVAVPAEFAQLHPVFGRLCENHGPPESGESKLITRSLKEGLTSLQFVLQPTSSTTNSSPVTRQIPGRMTVGHLRTLVRRLFKLAPSVTFDLWAQGERHRKINREIPLDADTREVGYHCLENGDTVYVRVVPN